MAGEIPSGESSVFHFLDIYALGFGLEACGALFLRKSWWWVALGVIGSIFFHLLGTKWPRIKPRVSPRFASMMERIAANRFYRVAICSLIAVSFISSVGVGTYRHYHLSTGRSSPAQTIAKVEPVEPARPAPVEVPAPAKSIANSKRGEPQTIKPTEPNRSEGSNIDISSPGITSRSQFASHIHFNHIIAPKGADLSGCDNCSVSNSVVGPVKAGPGTVVHGSDVNGSVVCKPRNPPLHNEPYDCQTVAVTNNLNENTALDNRNGKIGEAYVSGNTVRPSLNSGSAKAVDNSHGEIQKLTDTENDVGPISSAVPPRSIIPEDPEKAVQAVNRMRDSLTEIIEKKETVTFLMSWPDNDNSYLVFVSHLLSEACRKTPRQCWFTQQGNPQDLDKPPIHASGTPGITVHGPDAYALASALGDWFITHSTSTFPPELGGYNEYHTKEIIWIEIGPGLPWKPTIK